MQGVVMHAFTLASCQIMPHDIVVVTGAVLLREFGPSCYLSAQARQCAGFFYG